VKFGNSDGEIEAAKLLLCVAAVRVELLNKIKKREWAKSSRQMSGLFILI
jgi:hypothetical protein